jgi:cell fate regulator YaaT (PSP1 superfamily)
MSCTNCSFNKDSSARDEFTITEIAERNSSYDWLNDVPDDFSITDIVEVKFKNNRKEFYRNTNRIRLKYNEAITVQVPAGYDVGVVSLKGLLAEKQYKRKIQNPDLEKLGIIYRKATESDLKSWQEGKKLENSTLIKTRQIAGGLKLDMKVSDVEYQGDKKKATFFYIADGRVDFRELIKVLAQEFKIKIEMKQIGSRQEAAKIGGIGSCGKELCCSTWRNELPSVSTNTIQAQNLSPNAEKYTGKCGKLKCCLTYELASYLEAKSDFPTELLELETQQGIAYPHKIDVLRKTVWYTFKTGSANEIAIEVGLERIKEVIALNKRGKKVENLVPVIEA